MKKLVSYKLLEEAIEAVDSESERTGKTKTAVIEDAVLFRRQFGDEAEAAGSRLPLPYSTRRRAVRRARIHLGLAAWPQDVLRHTCASYWVAKIKDVGEVALELGNSPSVLLRHYRELVTGEDADRFWAIKP